MLMAKLRTVTLLTAIILLQFALLAPVAAAPADEICAFYAHTPVGDVTHTRCLKHVRREWPKWLGLLTFRGDIDYDKMCPMQESQLMMDCFTWAGRAVMWRRGMLPESE